MTILLPNLSNVKLFTYTEEIRNFSIKQLFLNRKD